MTEAELDAMVDGMSLAEASAAAEYIETLAKKKQEGMFYNYEPQAHQVAVHADKRKIVDVMGGNRCLGGEQEIFDPIENKFKRVDRIDGDFHVWAWDGKQKVIALAHRPFQKAKADLYRLTFDDGVEIVVSPHHLLWGPKGWLECRLYVEKREVVVPHPATNWDTYLLTHPEDVEHLRYIVQGYQSDCQPHQHSYDGRPHLAPTSGQEIQPLRGDVLAHKHESCDHSHEPLDDLDDKPSHTHVYHKSSRLSNLDGLRRLVAQFAGNGFQTVYTLLKRVCHSLQAFGQFLHGSIDQFQPIVVSGPQANHSLLDFFRSRDLSHQLSVSIPSFTTSNRSVVQIGYLRNDFVWDFEVEDHHNYFIGDILSHNSGKSHCCAFTIACHALGIYPSWWTGITYTHPIDIGIISISTEQMRKSAQVKLMGEPFSIGTGFIPKDMINMDELHWRAGTNGCLDWVLVKHSSGGWSRLNFMVNEQGQKKFMGYAWDLAWFDEEPEMDVFDEVQMRLVDKRGNIILSYYPYNGETELVQKLDKMSEEFCGHYSFYMGDNKTLDPEVLRMHEESMPEWQKESRMYGRPGVGAGRIFSFSKDDYVIERFEIENHWPRIGGFDVGLQHGTAAVALALEYVARDEAPVVYVYREYLKTGNMPGVHAITLRSWGDIDLKIDTSSHRRSPTDGQNLYTMYQNEGLNISNADTKSGSVADSINTINQMIAEKRLFVFDSCPQLIREMGLYKLVKSKDGRVKVTEKEDDLIDALRYAIMALNEARVPGVSNMKPAPKIVQWHPQNPRLGL